MNEKTPDQADTPGLALDQLRLLGDLLSCLDAAGYDPEDTQQLQLALAARLRPRAGRPLPGPEYDDQALRPEPDEALLDSLDIAALIARSSLGTPSARRIRSMTSAGQITEILRRRGQAATTGHQPPAGLAGTAIPEAAPRVALPAGDPRPAEDTQPRRLPRWLFRTPSARNLLIARSRARSILITIAASILLAMSSVLVIRANPVAHQTGPATSASRDISIRFRPPATLSHSAPHATGIPGTRPVPACTPGPVPTRVPPKPSPTQYPPALRPGQPGPTPRPSATAGCPVIVTPAGASSPSR